MPHPMTMAPAQGQPLLHRALSGIAMLERIPNGFIALVARLSIAGVFWQSGQTKLDGWRVSENAIYLFENEYRLPLLSPWLAAHMAAFAEHLFPVLLVLGLASRLSALALLGMTLVIEIFVYPDAWPTHGTWAACLLVVIARGPGLFSLDHLIAQRLERNGASTGRTA
ncbi:DoxX family protein [Rhizobium cremeum]|uniref:DoxX family protein n=1 Tax=Rhizobium cremeum TaxID=2813827 RepID=UPI0039DF78F0